MEMQNQCHSGWCKKIGIVLVIILLAHFGMRMFGFGPRGFGGDRNVNTISFTGHGEVTAVPDIANVSFTIEKSSKAVKDAQAGVAEVEKKAIEFLTKEGNIALKDIKTENASFYPKYEYRYDAPSMMPCTQYGCPPNPGKSIITGYTATESVTVKIRNTDDAGKVIQGLGALGVSALNGPAFEVDDEDGLKAEARKQAIDEAKEKAKVLAKDLGVRLVRITSFSENGNYPIMYGAGKMMVADSVAMPAPAELPKGENIISSDVTITYEIR
ncbi:MAG: SIMPL domain-containing protein [Candidatus Paceibacterota bacterium]|jgi:hypothetical protein